jgi:hypothetical protein
MNVDAISSKMASPEYSSSSGFFPLVWEDAQELWIGREPLKPFGLVQNTVARDVLLTEVEVRRRFCFEYWQASHRGSSQVLTPWFRGIRICLAPSLGRANRC